MSERRNIYRFGSVVAVQKVFFYDFEIYPAAKTERNLRNSTLYLDFSLSQDDPSLRCMDIVAHLRKQK